MGQASRTALIIKPRNPRNHVPKFQAKLRVPEQEADVRFQWLEEVPRINKPSSQIAERRVFVLASMRKREL